MKPHVDINVVVNKEISELRNDFETQHLVNIEIKSVRRETSIAV